MSFIIRHLSNKISAYAQIAVTYPGLGMGWSGSSAVVVPLVVTTVSPSVGSMAGGLTVTITGTGFSANPSDKSVAFGTVPCTIVSSSPSSLVCITGALKSGASAAAVTVAASLPLNIATLPDQQAPTAVPSFAFTYDPTLTDVVTAVNTTRGSTAGGTPLLIQGSFGGSAADYSVLIGDVGVGANCSIVDFTSTAITCM